MNRIDWKLYEDQVARLFQRLKGATVDCDVEEQGEESKTNRQLDIRVLVDIEIDIGHGFKIAVPVKIVVDAKAHKRPLDIKEIESLAGLRSDVRANLLVVISPHGVTEGARERARSIGVFPITVTADLLDLAVGLPVDKFYPCLICEFDEREERKTPEVWWQGPVEGRCDSCNGLHVRCGDCLEVFGIHETEYDKVFECPGGCGAIYFTVVEGRGKEAVRSLCSRDALETSVLKAASEKSSKSLTAREVDKLIEATRWQHWNVDSPLIGLTEEALMEWEDDRLKLIEEGQKVVDEVIARAESPLCY